MQGLYLSGVKFRKPGKQFDYNLVTNLTVIGGHVTNLIISIVF
jgi:hypothetical protein